MVEVFANNKEGIFYEPCKEPWKFVQEQVKRSNIKRYNWNAIFGQTLTKTILAHKYKGMKKDECVSVMINHPTIVELSRRDPALAADMCMKIKISVYARYGENNSSTRLYMQMRNHQLKQLTEQEQEKE